jgi:hypothetical protein
MFPGTGGFTDRPSQLFILHRRVREVPGYLNFGNVVIQRDVPIGSVLATAVTGAYNNGNPIAGCTREAWTARWEMTKWGR